MEKSGSCPNLTPTLWRAGAGAERRHRHRAREHDVRNVVLLFTSCHGQLLSLAVQWGVGRDRDRAGDQEERELLECARRTRVSSSGTPAGVLISERHGLVCAACSIISVLTQWGATLVVIQLRERRERDVACRPSGTTSYSAKILLFLFAPQAASPFSTSFTLALSTRKVLTY